MTHIAQPFYPKNRPLDAKEANFMRSNPERHLLAFGTFF
jgi:hypothetical protein